MIGAGVEITYTVYDCIQTRPLPASAGVILLVDKNTIDGNPIPRIRGGDPLLARAMIARLYYSPHPRG